jgi:hypothetical protein
MARGAIVPVAVSWMPGAGRRPGWVGWFGLKRPRTSVGRNGPKGWLRWETEENGNMPHKGVGRNQQWAAEILFRFKSRI